MSASCSILLRAAIINNTPGSGSVARSAGSSTGSVDRERLQQHIGYRFSRPELLSRALTHRSHSALHNERLEFLGDSVLNCVVAAELFERFAELPEGDLSRLRAQLVREETLYQVAQTLGMGDHLQLGEGELKSGGFARPSILADAFEALSERALSTGVFRRPAKPFVACMSRCSPRWIRRRPARTLKRFCRSCFRRGGSPCLNTPWSQCTGPLTARISRSSA